MLSQSIDSILPYEEPTTDTQSEVTNSTKTPDIPEFIGYDQLARRIPVEPDKIATGEQKLSEKWGLRGDQVEEKRKDLIPTLLQIWAPLLGNTLLSVGLQADASNNLLLISSIMLATNIVAHNVFINSDTYRSFVYELEKFSRNFSKSELAIIEDSILKHSISSFVPKRDLFCESASIVGADVLIAKGERVLCVNPTPLESSKPDSSYSEQEQIQRKQINQELLVQALQDTRKLILNDNTVKHVLILRHPSNIEARDPNIEHLNQMVMPFENGAWATHLSVAEFLSLTETPLSLTERLVEELADPVLSEYFNLLKNAKTETEQQKIKKMLTDHLFNSLQTQVTSIAGGSDIHRINPVQRARLYSDVSIRRKSINGSAIPEYFFLKTNQAEGQTVKPLSNVIGPKGVDINDIESILANHGSPYQKAQILYALLREIEYISSGKSLNRIQNNKDKQDLIAEIKKQNWSIDPLVFGDFKNALSYSPFTKLEQAKKTVLMSLLSFSVAFGTVSLGNFLAKEKHDGPKIPHTTSEIRTFSRPEFGPIPADDPLWQIKANGMDPSGYYVTGTSHEFTDGGWVNDVTIEDSVDDFPTSVEEGSSYLELSKIIPNSAGPIEFKIPTQVGTHLKALSLVDHLGKPVPKSASKILFFADGTVGFRIDGNESRSAYFFELKAYFSEAENNEPSPHANGKLTSIPFETLPQGLQLSLEQAKTLGLDPESLAQKIAESKAYSADAPEQTKRLLASADTPAKMLTAGDWIPTCDCEFCNTQFVLTSAISTKPNQQSDLNYAEGFFNKSDGFLSARESHAFAVDSKGRKFDATSSIPADGSTESSVTTISPHTTISMEEKYSRQTAEVMKSAIEEAKSREAEEAKRNKLQLELFGVGLLTIGAAASLYDYTKTINLLKDKWLKPLRASASEKVEYAKDMYRELQFFDLNPFDMVRIAGFLSEISYAKDFDEKRLASLKHFKNKKEFFEYLESNSNAFRLSVYLAQGNLSIDGDDSKIEQTQKLYANMNKLKEKYGFLKSDDQKLDRVINAYFNA